jgi:hypothetical protein
VADVNIFQLLQWKFLSQFFKGLHGPVTRENYCMQLHRFYEALDIPENIYELQMLGRPFNTSDLPFYASDAKSFDELCKATCKHLESWQPSSLQRGGGIGDYRDLLWHIQSEASFSRLAERMKDIEVTPVLCDLSDPGQFPWLMEECAFDRQHADVCMVNFSNVAPYLPPDLMNQHHATVAESTRIYIESHVVNSDARRYGAHDPNNPGGPLYPAVRTEPHRVSRRSHRGPNENERQCRS